MAGREEDKGRRDGGRAVDNGVWCLGVNFFLAMTNERRTEVVFASAPTDKPFFPITASARRAHCPRSRPRPVLPRKQFLFPDAGKIGRLLLSDSDCGSRLGSPPVRPCTCLQADFDQSEIFHCGHTRSVSCMHASARHVIPHSTPLARWLIADYPCSAGKGRVQVWRAVFVSLSVLDAFFMWTKSP